MMSRLHLPILDPADGTGALDATGAPDAAASADHAPPPAPLFSPGERQALLGLAAAVMPAGAVLPAAGARALSRMEAFLADAPRAALLGYRGLLHALDLEARAREGRRLGALSPERIVALCRRWHEGGYARRLLLRGLLTPLKVGHFDDAEMFRRVGAPYGRGGKPGGPASGLHDQPRLVRERTLEGAEIPDGEVIECDVVVVGTGAGGAACAKELAEAGCAVVLLEEGQYLGRGDFGGRTIDMQRRLYRDMGATSAVGNTVIPIPIGRSVGGTTTINGGTCYRMPERVLRKWQTEHGLSELTDGEVAALYERVEAVLGVAVSERAHLGGVADVIARGATALGYRHGPLRRNAPGCDGQGACYFGCPTDAKRSTNVSYVPLALSKGAQLITSARVEGLLTQGGRAAGVRVRGGGGARFTVRARATVLSCGALLTPALLLSDPAGRALGRSGLLGGNLSIHPAAAAFALMPEPVRGHLGIPQGYAIEEFHDEGLLFEGVFAPLDLTAASLTGFGPRYTEVMEGYEHLASFGFMVEEQSRGRVRPGPAGRPLITYYLREGDVARLKRGLEILAQVFLAAGAKSVLLQLPGLEEVRGPEDLRRLRAMRLAARDLDLTAYHPLGTARMGKDPLRSVVDSEGQAHDLPGLYIADGSILPGSPAVNPQLTIMALSTRVGQRLARRLD